MRQGQANPSPRFPPAKPRICRPNHSCPSSRLMSAPPSSRRGQRSIVDRQTAAKAGAVPPALFLLRPQNCGAAAHALAETGRVEDDPKLSRFYSGFYLQGDRSTTYAERAADTKLARLRRRPRGRERDCRFRRKPLARDFGSLSKPRSFGGCCCGNFRLGLRQHGPQRDRERDKRLVEIRGGEQSCGRYFSV